MLLFLKGDFIFMSSSRVAISYNDLERSAKKAHDVAKKFDDYADELFSKVQKKISNYNGPWTGNINDAYCTVNTKISDLKTMSSKFDDYSDDLEDLLEECQHIDDTVANKVRRLSGRFARRNGIKYTVVDAYIMEMVYKSGTSAKDRRYLYEEQREDLYDRYEDIKDDIHYYYEGGKERKKSRWERFWSATLDVLGFVGSLATFIICPNPLSFAGMMFSLGGLVEDCVDAHVDKKNEDLAYEMMRDPENAAMAYRLREIDTLDDYYLKGDILDENDESAFNQDYKGRRKNALIWKGTKLFTDIGSFACSVIGIGQNIKGAKNLTGGKISKFFQAIHGKGSKEYGWNIYSDIVGLGDFLLTGFTGDGPSDWIPTDLDDIIKDGHSMFKSNVELDLNINIKALDSMQAPKLDLHLQLPGGEHPGLLTPPVLPPIELPGINNPINRIPGPSPIHIPGTPNSPFHDIMPFHPGNMPGLLTPPILPPVELPGINNPIIKIPGLSPIHIPGTPNGPAYNIMPYGHGKGPRLLVPPVKPPVIPPIKIPVPNTPGSIWHDIPVYPKGTFPAVKPIPLPVIIDKNDVIPLPKLEEYTIRPLKMPSYYHLPEIREIHISQMNSFVPLHSC